MSKRPPNELESKLHQAALASAKNELSGKQAEAIVPDVTARQNALNFLLGVGLLKSMVDTKGSVSFRAVTKNELMATKDLSLDEQIVLGQIKASGNEGVWTKHLKAKANLHQTVIDRCLKTLTQKRLIKRVLSVQHPTRKIYMLEGLDPSVALTGGPWYTDSELDTEFIQHLTEACLKFIRDQTFPKRRGDRADGALYALSNSPDYPTAEQIRDSLRKARLTETNLTTEHVEMLLNVLVLDGEVERLPSFGAAMWNASLNSESEDSDRHSKKKRRKNKGSNSKRKRRETSDSESDSADASRKKAKRSRSKYASGSDTESDPHSKKKRKKRTHDREEESGSDSEDVSSKKTKKSRSKRTNNRSDSDSSDESEDERKKHKLSKLSPSPVAEWEIFDTSGGGGYVYRAIRKERVSVAALEAPCSSCPSFEFCKDGGPVNPRDCVYYGDWLVGGAIASIEGE